MAMCDSDSGEEDVVPPILIVPGNFDDDERELPEEFRHFSLRKQTSYRYLYSCYTFSTP